jgi:16S rRNA (adenine1518-N6/adenine1519-N6)-dimethyltransferase
VSWVRRELDSMGIPPLKKFGQHFLIDKAVRHRLVDLAQLRADDTVLEVGPGLGFLTAALIRNAGRVIAIEKDRTLAAYLKRKFMKEQNLTVVQGDALTFPIPDGSKVVSSPPYNISSKLTLLITGSQCRLAALLMQEEFVRRLMAPSGSRDYGRISVMLQSKATAEFQMKVPPEAFYPKPKIESALVIIRPASEKLQPKDDGLFIDMVRAIFTQRRRKLRGVLMRYLKTRYPLSSNRIAQRISVIDKRVYELNPNELMTLSNQIADAVAGLGRE